MGTHGEATQPSQASTGALEPPAATRTLKRRASVDLGEAAATVGEPVCKIRRGYACLSLEAHLELTIQSTQKLHLQWLPGAALQVLLSFGAWSLKGACSA